jgi:CRP/FNR family cyclic AMP-dependent transcriptional regulator
MPAWTVLSVLTEEDARLVLAAARRRTFKRGEVVFHRDDPADTIHLVSSGCFAARVSTPLGDVVTLSLMGPGESFGEMALVRADHVRSATVSALEAGETRVLSLTEFDRLRRERPALDALLVELLARRVADLGDRLVEALYTPAPRRVVKLLDDLADRYATEAGVAVIPLTQDDLAGLAGTSRLTVSRVLRGLRERGQVEVKRGQLTIRR